MLAASKEKDDCICEYGIEAFQKDPKQAEQEISLLIQDPLVRDYFWLKITREYNSSTQRYCQKITDQILQKRCITLVRRPHLYRED